MAYQILPRLERKCATCGKALGWTFEPARVDGECIDCYWERKFAEGAKKRDEVTK